MEGPRTIRPEETGKLGVLLDSVFKEGKSGAMFAGYPLLLNDGNAENLIVMSDGDLIVSHNGYVPRDVEIFGCRLGTGSIGSVATDSNYRGKGLASRLLLDVFDRMRKTGLDIAIISGTRGLYLNNGATEVGRCSNTTVSMESLGDSRDSDIVVEEVSADSTGIAERLYAKEPVRFVRKAEEWEFFFDSGMCMGRAARMLLATGTGDSAYAIVSRDVLDDVVKVMEFAGDRRLIPPILRKVAAELPSIQVAIPVMAWDTALLAELEDQYVKQVEILRHHTAVRIINFPQLIERLQPLFAGLCGEDTAQTVSGAEVGDKMVLSVGDESFEYDQGQAAKMIFGELDDSKEGGQIPVPEILRESFPIPVPWYGLNYT